jgi:hypothetical protein
MPQVYDFIMDKRNIKAKPDADSGRDPVEWKKKKHIKRPSEKNTYNAAKGVYKKSYQKWMKDGALAYSIMESRCQSKLRPDFGDIPKTARQYYLSLESKHNTIHQNIHLMRERGFTKRAARSGCL